MQNRGAGPLPSWVWVDLDRWEGEGASETAGDGSIKSVKLTERAQGHIAESALKGDNKDGK